MMRRLETYLDEICEGATSAPARTVQAGVPATRTQRDLLKRQAEQLAEQRGLTPPLSLDELRQVGEEACRAASVNEECAAFAAVLVNNAAWRETVARIPYEKRLLLLPQCLRDSGGCPAAIDEFGLLCEGCGRCSIHALQSEAEELGYAVLVAEGSTLVTKMIEEGKIEAVIGVSCLSVLEKCHPHMEARAVPGMAFPLLCDGCRDTMVEPDWVREAIHASSQDRTRRLDLNGLKQEVNSWFEPAALDELLGAAADETERIARDWLSRDGKRWRPYLTVCVHASLQGEPEREAERASRDLKLLAVAVECFHKASLIHDDIEDDDDERYGRQALHVEYGMPAALNVGDFLIGEGYRIIGELSAADSVKAAMYRIASSGHLTLSRGQGAELCWMRSPRPLTPGEVLDIFRQKTSPAFEVALRLGAAAAGAGDRIHEVLRQYSESLGTAYQIRDDLEDYFGEADSDDLRDRRPSIVMAALYKRAAAEAERETIASFWRGERHGAAAVAEIRGLMERYAVTQAVPYLLDQAVEQTVLTLRELDNPSLKGLLRRVVGKIFGGAPAGDYCRRCTSGHSE